jgi:hypothetical protein
MDFGENGVAKLEDPIEAAFAREVTGFVESLR